MLHNFTCKDITERASDYLEQKMSRWDRFKFRLHIFICHDCRRFLQQFKGTLSSLKTLKSPKTASPALDQQVETLLKVQRTRQDRQPGTDD